MSDLKGIEIGFPVGGKYVITSFFAAPRPYIAWGLKHQHEGIDIAPVGPHGPYPRWALAVRWGVVSGRGYDPEFMGSWVEIAHERAGALFYTRYHHLREIYVTEGERVSQYERLGEIGDTGYATGVHLHFMLLIERNGHRVAIDPLPFFPPAVRDAVAGRR